MNSGVLSKKERIIAFNESRKREFTRWFGKKRHHKMVTGHKIDVRTVYDIFNWMCILCDKEIEQHLPENHPESVSLEHVIPFSKGGTHTWFNIGPAHVKCNIAKNDTVDHELIDKVFNLWLNV